MTAKNLEELNTIIGKYITDSAHPSDRSLFLPPVALAAYDMAQLFLDIERTFAIELHSYVGNLHIFSRDELATGLENALRVPLS